MCEPLWTPSAESVASANLTAFRRLAEQEHGLKLGSYAELYDWSIRRPEQFWSTMWWFGGIVASRPWDTVVEDRDRMPGARWFVGSRLNFAENLLRHRDDRPAIIFHGENGTRRALTFAEVHDVVARLAQSLRARRYADPASQRADAAYRP